MPACPASSTARESQVAASKLKAAEEAAQKHEAAACEATARASALCSDITKLHTQLAQRDERVAALEEELVTANTSAQSASREQQAALKASLDDARRRMQLEVEAKVAALEVCEHALGGASMKTWFSPPELCFLAQMEHAKQLEAAKQPSEATLKLVADRAAAAQRAQALADELMEVQDLLHTERRRRKRIQHRVLNCCYARAAVAVHRTHTTCLLPW